MRRERVPKYWLTTFFTELEELVKIKRPNEYERFLYYNLGLNSTFRNLEFIISRYEEDKKNVIKIFERLNKFNEKVERLSQDDLLKEIQEIDNKRRQYFTALVVDNDSFIIFSKVLLDEIPYLIKPLTKGIVTNQDVAVWDFTDFVDWFACARKKHPKDILDSTFSDEIISFGDWFKKKLKYPRDKIIVHPAKRTIKSILKSDAKLVRTLYELKMKGGEIIWKEIDSLEMPDIKVILEKIVEFLDFLNKYFCEKLF